ncbi:unnamed protein product [Angiostrongylus costaricensis]|uniref:Uncharacterized protein n=1 Tax=Angiostrongylus costaricensis TaxID=334426 RepID=A0A0R3PEC5_ANGCS|nr:unnamed protein product [Angiostrongylus costaricensis]
MLSTISIIRPHVRVERRVWVTRRIRVLRRLKEPRPLRVPPGPLCSKPRTLTHAQPVLGTNHPFHLSTVLLALFAGDLCHLSDGLRSVDATLSYVSARTLALYEARLSQHSIQMRTSSTLQRRESPDCRRLSTSLTVLSSAVVC